MKTGIRFDHLVDRPE